MTKLIRLFLAPLLGIMGSLLFSNCAGPAVSATAISQAQKRLEGKVGRLPSKGTLIVVDYSKPSSQKRMTIMDLRSKSVRGNLRVAHGVNSGKVYATDFSNRPGSRKSSLGLYKVAEEYRGKHGISFRLDGLDHSNSRARARAIVVHAAEYATYGTMLEHRNEGYRLGRSAGCFAVSPSDMSRLGSQFSQGPAYIYAYAPPRWRRPREM